MSFVTLFQAMKSGGVSANPFRGRRNPSSAFPFPIPAEVYSRKISASWYLGLTSPRSRSVPGLGLLIVRRIVRAHGGEVIIEVSKTGG